MWTVAVQQHFFYTTEARVHSDMECVGRVVGGGGQLMKIMTNSEYV